MSASSIRPETWRLTGEDMQAIERLRKELLDYARRRTGSTADAEDVYGETIVAAGRSFEHRSSIRHYLFSILKRQLANIGRRKQRGCPWSGAQPIETEFDDVFVDHAGPDTQLSWLRNARKISASVERLPTAYREVVRLAVDGYDNFEIAAQLGIQYNTVRSKLSRGNAYLSELLQDDGQRSEGQGDDPKRNTKRGRRERVAIGGAAACTV